MKTRITHTRFTSILWIISIIIGLVMHFMTGVPIWVVVLYALAEILFLDIRFEMRQSLYWVWTILVITLGSAVTMFCVQYLILDSNNFWKTSDWKLFLNGCCVAVVTLIFLIITNSVRISCIISHILFILFGFVDYFVWQFRQNEFTIGDILGAGTGLSVASKYNFSLNIHAGMVLLISLLYVTLVYHVKLKHETRWQMMLLSGLLSICIVLWVSIYAMDYNTETWEQKGSYRNGYILNFFLGLRDSIVKAPKGYDLSTIDELEKAYNGDGSEHMVKTELTGEKTPTVIVIMNESFSDLSVIGELKTNQTVTPFIDSLKENTTRGYALSSVYGAKTPNSEWEFLTGNTMAFLPTGSVVYQQYLKAEPTSLVSTMKNEGYTCVAMHPYYETGWSRNQVYPNLGFDEMYFIDDFDQTQIARDYIKDQELYRKIIERFESKGEDESLFIMSVTMQNHGGYGSQYANFENTVNKTGLSYTDVNQYLSLIHMSDEAVEDLIAYFSSVEEPVEIVFFGDHQPGLNSKFYELLNEKGLSGLDLEELQNLYKVPFFIWTNYDSPEEEIEITSLNYLSTLALERANIELPAYNQYLADLMEDIPAINVNGYYSKETNGFVYFGEGNEEEQALIQTYEALQYNNLFDVKNQSQWFFPYIK